MDTDPHQQLAGMLRGLAKRSLPLGAQQLRIEFGDFGFDADGLAELDRVRDWLLRRNGWGEKYSEKHLTEMLAKVIGDLRSKPDYGDARRAAETLRQDWLGFDESRLVYVPIENATMTLHKLEIGRARFVQISPKVRREFEAGVRHAWATSPKPRHEAELWVQHLLGRYDALGKVVSVVAVTADVDRAVEVATEETRRALDFVNYAASVVWGTSLRRAAGIEGDGFRGARSHFAVTSDFTQSSSSRDFKRGVAAVTLNGDFKRHLSKLGYTKVSGILTDPTPNDLEEAVIQALHWYSDAWLQSSIENEVLGLTAALETFFTQQGRAITSQLAEGVAFVLAQGLQYRKRVVGRVRYLYGLRGNVTHGGQQQILPAEVDELRFYVLNVINTMIRNPKKWESREALREWIDDQRLS